MPSCRSCRAPLHGTEDFCPACGTPLRSRSSGREIPLQQPPGINPFPIIGIVIILGIIGIMCLKDSWIGQVLTHPYKEDPMSKISVLDARTTIENQIINGVTALGIEGYFQVYGGRKARAEVDSWSGATESRYVYKRRECAKADHRPDQRVFRPCKNIDAYRQ